ncbi:MAG: DUF924 domain-containing protein [Candidatus Andeanibacterium colombiense]|uniref:DUF924 domain-containing protein n=1 Tax=Candidatus Andeanibacterium colombiense TaxID=3121345 RepID=A0AAJ6BMS8_9SPHN|nr:MAG: DUF924 domain-containing protein [Sphingomonadaceae bacterium]
MAAAPRRWAAELLHFWFHRLGPDDWFRGGPGVDEALRKRFEPDLLSLFTQSADSFLSDPLTARAAILLFDQVPRNLYRGSAEAFAFDPLARHICYGVLAKEWDKGLTRVERQFLGLPLEHSEDMADQRASLTYFAGLDAHTFSYARSHYRMIARFGRFPHRNEALGRTSTPEELAAIAAGNSW